MAKELKFPYNIEDVTEDEKNIISTFYDIEAVKISSTKYCLPKRMLKYAQEFYNFEPKRNDIWLSGFPRSGTTMIQEILYLLETNLDYKQAESNIMDVRFPFLEQALVRNEDDEKLYENGNKLSDTSKAELLIPAHVKLARINENEKRFIKSHLGFNILHPQLLDVGCKVVFIARNIKDCMSSLYYYPDKSHRRDDSGFKKLFPIFKNHLVPWGNYFELLKEAWKRRNNPNLLFVFYEEIISDTRKSIFKIATFLNKELTENEVKKLLDHINIDNFKNNKSVNNDHLVELGVYEKSENVSFIRKGKSGSWRELFTKELNEEVNEWIKENLNEIPDFNIPNCWKKAMDME